MQYCYLPSLLLINTTWKPTGVGGFSNALGQHPINLYLSLLFLVDKWSLDVLFDGFICFDVMLNQAHGSPLAVKMTCCSLRSLVS